MEEQEKGFGGGKEKGGEGQEKAGEGPEKRSLRGRQKAWQKRKKETRKASDSVVVIKAEDSEEDQASLATAAKKEAQKHALEQNDRDSEAALWARFRALSPPNLAEAAQEMLAAKEAWERRPLAKNVQQAGIYHLMKFQSE